MGTQNFFFVLRSWQDQKTSFFFTELKTYHLYYFYLKRKYLVFRVRRGSNEGYDLSKTNVTEFNLVISIIPVFASCITLCIMRSFLSLVERTSKGKASVNNKHLTCDLLSSIELGSNYHPQSEYGLMLVEHHKCRFIFQILRIFVRFFFNVRSLGEALECCLLQE